ncbi:MAG: RluA family pseudouridine synthase [Patescibacteria group bacterium]
MVIYYLRNVNTIAFLSQFQSNYNMLDIIYEDKDFIAVNKPAGLLVHPTKFSEDRALTDELLEKYPEIKDVGDDPLRPGIVHRLDKDTTGVVLVARNAHSFGYLKGLFHKHEIDKSYLALVMGSLEGNGVVDKPIGLRSGTTRRSVNAKDMKMIKPAVTKWYAMERFIKDNQVFTLVRLIPETGRTHQLRVHMAYIHKPVVGDPLYGPKKSPLSFYRQALHADSVEFTKEDGKRLKLGVDMSKDMRDLIDNLEKSE